MSNQCNKCGSRNTATVKAKDMAKKTGDSNFMTAASGMISPAPSWWGSQGNIWIPRKAIRLAWRKREKWSKCRRMQGLRILGESVSMQTIPFDNLAFDDLCKPFGSQRNDYSYFQSLISRFGVYIVQEKETGKCYMLAKLMHKTWRNITQNYTERDTGGTFQGTTGVLMKAKILLNLRRFEQLDDKDRFDWYKSQGLDSSHWRQLLISALKPQHNKWLLTLRSEGRCAIKNRAAPTGSTLCISNIFR